METDTAKKGRGRPKGSLNKKGKKEIVKAFNEDGTPRGKGRPKGSPNKPKPKPKGRPNGSKSSYTVSPAALAQRREQINAYPARTDEEAQYNARQIEHILRIHEIAQNADRNDLLSLKSCFIAYLKLCQEDGFKVGNLAAYGAMGFDYATFSRFAQKDDPEIREFCKFVRETCAMFRENMVSDNKINPVIGIFWQRNYDGLRNDTEQVQALNQQDDIGTTKGYKDKYRSLIGGD